MLPAYTCIHVYSLCSVGTKSLKIPNTFASPNFQNQWRNRPHDFTHIFGLILSDDWGQDSFQKSQIHNPKHSQYNAQITSSPTYIWEIVQHMESCSSGEMKSPLEGSNPHGEHATFPTSPMWGMPPGLLVVGISRSTPTSSESYCTSLECLWNSCHNSTS
jgi:hypothetical protein